MVYPCRGFFHGVQLYPWEAHNVNLGKFGGSPIWDLPLLRDAQPFLHNEWFTHAETSSMMFTFIHGRLMMSTLANFRAISSPRCSYFPFMVDGSFMQRLLPWCSASSMGGLWCQPWRIWENIFYRVLMLPCIVDASFVKRLISWCSTLSIGGSCY